MDNIPPHFHKDYRINEEDLIPDNSVYADFPNSAEEGRRITIENPALTFKFYQYLKGAWRQIGAQSASLTLLGSTTLTAANANIDVSFTPAEFLKAVFEMTDNLSSGNSLHLRFNNDTAANYISKVEINAGGHTEYASATSIYLNDGAYQRQQTHEISITNRQNYQKRALWKGSVINGQISPLVAVDGFGNWNNVTDQISQVRITADGVKTFPIGTKLSVYGI